MASVDLALVERRARSAYELSRARRALLGFAPALPIFAGVACMSERAGWALAFGGAVFAVAVTLLWIGRDLGRTVLPGLGAGAIPLLLALAARHFHVCTGDVCLSLCVPACTAGGLLAGLAVAYVGAAQRPGRWYWFAASGVTILTGAMGCSCVGLAGVIGLGLGYAAGVVPGLLRVARIGGAA